jgi:hypothetical protein
MQTLARAHMIVIKDIDHTTTIDENVNETNTSIIENFYNLRAPFLHLPLL